jgi:hypothetical protein
MSSEQDREGAPDVLPEILAGRKFSLAEAIGREGGSAFLKGESPLPQLLQAKAEINLFIDRHVTDPAGALKAVLQTLVAADDVYISRHPGAPLDALREFLTLVIGRPQLLYELVRQVDVRWGQHFGERPRFQRPGEDPLPDDEYTHESVHQRLAELLDSLPRR